MDDCLVAVAVAEARPPPDEYKPDSGDDFSDREDEDVAPVTRHSKSNVRKSNSIELNPWIEFD